MPLTELQTDEQFTPSTDRLYVCFERHVDAEPRWYSNIYKWAVESLQRGRPIEYSHVFVLVYSSVHKLWYILEVKYVMGEHDNGVSVGTTDEDVVIIPRGGGRGVTAAFISDDDVALYPAKELDMQGVDTAEYVEWARDMHDLVTPVSTWQFIKLYLTGDCDSYVCTDFVTTLLGTGIDIVTTPDVLYELL